MNDHPTSKIALSDLDKLEELLDQAPTYRSSVVSKRQAVARLAPKLHAMRRKGYSWAFVAAWLTEHGVAMTPAVLTGYLRDLPAHPQGVASGALKARRKSRLPQNAELSASEAAMPQEARVPAPAPVAPLGPNGVAKPSAARRAESGARRSEFAVRPDSDEI